ncbi:hypothetical protein [Streptomyces sp. UNOB3_S3]|uniref:hypothetical protein n=1 Tax=Streptomyces sp. UNOB3_S3 TaxID=2871682 RepID=UPI001E454492|nr:hypothetical protein [Streptomyces sp. UNOB3_S3]MCC3776552.1 hypothetical protein [Streptomyces sp. UNOB3_S3]
MRWMSIALAAVATVGVMSTPAAAAQLRADGPPWPYKDCVETAVKQHKETPSHAKWHCDELAKKGWVKPPTAEDNAAQSTNPKGTGPKSTDPKGTGPKSGGPKGHHSKGHHPTHGHPKGHHPTHGKTKPKQ